MLTAFFAITVPTHLRQTALNQVRVRRESHTLNLEIEGRAPTYLRLQKRWKVGE